MAVVAMTSKLLQYDSSLKTSSDPKGLNDKELLMENQYRICSADEQN